MIKDLSKIRNGYIKKVENVTKIYNSNFPVSNSEKIYTAQKRREMNARKYIYELEYIDTFLKVAKNVFLVSKQEFLDMTDLADYYHLEFDGVFVKLCLLQKIDRFGYEDIWVLYMAPLNQI